MANHPSHAALPYPIKGARFSLLIPYLDADGDPTDPTTPDTELSKDDAAAADATEEVATLKNSVALLTLTGAETDCSCLGLAGKATSGPKTTLGTLFPRVLAVVGSGTLSAGSAGGGTLGTLLAYDVTGCFIKTTGGTGGGGTGGANNQARKIVTYNTGTGAFTVVPNWETTPSTDTTYDVLLPEGVTLGMLRALNPTTAGRTLDVSAAGNAGIDWSNVEAPTTTLVLSGTTIGVVTLVGTLTTYTGNTPQTGDAFARIGVAGVGLTNIGDTRMANLDATITSRMATFTLPTNFSALLINASGHISRVTLADTLTTYTGNTPQTGDVYALANGASGFVALAGYVDDIGVAGAGLTALGDTRLANLDATVSSRLASASYTAPPSAASNADAVWDEVLSGHLGVGSTGEALNAAGAAGDPWTTALPGAYGAGSAGKIIGDNIDAAISSRAAASALATAQTDLDTLTGTDGATLATAQALYAPSKAGDAMALTSGERTTLAAVIWNSLTSGMSTVGSIGKKLADWVVGTIDTYTGNTKQTGDVGVAGAGLTALGDARIANLDAAVSTRATPAQVATELSTYDVPTNAEMVARTLAAADYATAAGVSSLASTLATILGHVDTEIAAILQDTGTDIPALIAALNNLSSAQAQTAAAAALTAYDPPTRTEATADKDEILVQAAAVKVWTDRLGTAMEIDGAVYRFTTNALEMAPAGGGGGGGATMATAIPAIGDTSAGSQGEALRAILNMTRGKRTIVNTGTEAVPVWVMRVYQFDDVTAIWATLDIDHPVGPSSVVPA